MILILPLRRFVLAHTQKFFYREFGTGHSARSGAGSAAAQSDLQPHQICHLAGVKDINWLVGYMREGVSDRLRASWAVGL